MSILHTLLNMPLVQQLGWSLLHFIWQGILISIACGLLLKLPFARSARANYRICLGGLLLCAAAPVVTFFAIQPVITAPALLTEQPSIEQASTKQTSAEALSAMQDGARDATHTPSSTEPQPPTRRSALFIPAATQLDGTPVVSMLDLPDAEITPQPWHEQWSQKLAPYVPWLVVLWFPLALLLSLRLGWQWGQTHKWVRNATDCLPQTIGIDLPSLCKRAGIRFPVRLLESLRVAGPLTVGFIKPVILVPVGFLASLSPEHIEAILLHELAHIRRRDFLVNLITSVVTALLFYHPIVWWLDKRTRLAREICCDELAAASCGDVRTYAHALAKLETWRQQNAAIALAANDGSLLQRIRALAGQRTAAGLSGRSLANLTAIFTLTLGAVLLLQFSPSAEAKDDVASNLPTKPAPSGIVIGSDGKPLAGAQVVLYHMEYFYGLDNGIIETVSSDAEGRFAFTTKLTYVTYQGDPEREEYYAVTWAPEQAVAIAIFDRSATTTQDTQLRLSQPETRTVKVTDKDGKPLAGALVNVHSISTDNRENWANFKPAFGPLQATTDASGLAVFNQLPKGDISFRAQKEGYSPNWSGCNSGEKTEVAIILRPGASVSGRVTLTDGNPASNITVYATPLWPLHDFTLVRTDADGNFTISGLYGTGDAWHADGGTGAYRIGIADPQLDATPQDVTLSSGESASGLQLVARSGTQVTGILLDQVSHKPVAYAELYVTTPGNNFSILSDAEGRFRFRTLPGVFEVRFQMPPQGSYVLQYAGLSTYPDSVSEMIANYPASVTLYTPSEVRKLINVEGRVFAPDGKPAANVTVAAEIMTPGRLRTSNQALQGTGPVKTDAEGYYQFTAYPVDLPMRLIARGNNGILITEAAAVSVDAPQLADITLQPAKTARIRIVDLDGKPLAKQRIAYGSATRSSNPQRATGVPSVVFRMEQRTTTDADGIAILRNLSPD